MVVFITSRNLPVGYPEVPQVPSKVGPKFRAMVRLDALGRKIRGGRSLTLSAAASPHHSPSVAGN